jgi:hypothetical protein
MFVPYDSNKKQSVNRLDFVHCVCVTEEHVISMSGMKVPNESSVTGCVAGQCAATNEANPVYAAA